MKILVTGATGFIGQNLVAALIQQGYDVSALVRETSDTEKLPKQIQLIEGDLLDKESLQNAVKNQDVVIHLAAYYDFYPKDVDLLYRVNVNGTQNLITACAEASVKRFIYGSSTEAIGVVDDPPANEESKLQPAYDYGKSKVLAENVIREVSDQSNLEYVILQAVGVAGPGEFYLGFETIKAIANQEISMIPGDGQKHIMFIHIDDVVSGFLAAIESASAANNTFILCTDDVLSYEELFKVVASQLGVDPPKRKVPVALAKLGVGLIGFFKHRGERTYLWHMKSVDAINSERWYSNQKAKTVLGWRPSMTMEEALRRSVDWYVAEGYIKKKEVD